VSETSKLPNILIFMPDEMRGDAISLNGNINPVIKTPHIDSLIENGVSFTNCFTVNPVCAPSRCCTFTGQYVHSGAHRSLFQLLQPHEENLLKFLKNKGYEVVWVGRNDLFTRKASKLSVTKRIPMSLPLGNIKDVMKKVKFNPFGKDDKFRKSFYFGKRSKEQGNDVDTDIINKALHYLDSNPTKPFCLFIALNFPHPPYTIEEPYFSMYDRNKIPSPIPPKLGDKPHFMRIIHERYGLNKLNEEDFKEIIATYYGMVTKIDNQLGQVIKKLKQNSMYEDTTIVFTSDHGDYTGDYGLTEKWPNAFQDCLIRVPLVIKLPNIEAKQKIFNDLVQTIDIFPTLLEFGKVKTKYTHFGISLLPLIKGETETHRDAVYAEGGYNLREPQCFEPALKNPDVPHLGIYYDKTNIPVEDPATVARSTMIRTNKWKLIIRSAGKEELYDLTLDPKEIHNLIDDNAYKGIQISLKEKLLRWYLNTSDNAHWKRARDV